MVLHRAAAGGCDTCVSAVVVFLATTQRLVVFTQSPSEKHLPRRLLTSAYTTAASKGLASMLALTLRTAAKLTEI